MSCYEWEFGSIKLPAKRFTPFRKEIVATVNADLERQLIAANRLRDDIIAEYKGKRNVNFREVFWRRSENARVSDGVIYRMFNNIEATERPKKVTRKDMGFVKASETTFDVDGEGSIIFDAKTKTVTWSVSENNHACETARKTPIGRSFFNLLNRTTWTRGSGGIITGNDEYNRDDHCEGGGGNYVTGRYGNV